MVITESNNAWWMYRIVGVQVPSTSSIFDQSLLTDANLISRNDAQTLMSRYSAEFPEDKRQGLDQIIDIWFGDKSVRFDSVLLIDSGRPLPPTKEAAREGRMMLRARRLAAVLSFAVLTASENRRAVALADWLPRMDCRELVIDKDNVRLGLEHHASSYTEPFIASAFAVDHAKLAEILRTSRISKLANVMLLPEQDGELRRAVRQAAVLFNESIASPTLELRLLGCVTAIEILLKDRSTDYDTLKNRVARLIGSDFSRLYKADTVIAHRHGFVHEGKETIGQTVYAAACLAEEVLIQASERVEMIQCLKQHRRTLDDVGSTQPKEPPA